MAKKTDMTSALSNYETEAVRREDTIGRRFLRIALKTLVLLSVLLALFFVFCLGFILNESRYRDRLNGIHFYVHDKYSLESHYTKMEKEFCNEKGVSHRSPEAKEYGAEVREQWRPLVEVGPFYIMEYGGKFSVNETSSLLPLVQLEKREQSKKLILFSSLEKGWKFPRFRSHFRYSGDSKYADGDFAVFWEDMTPERVYFDIDGVGVFDIMYIFENGERFTYYLNGLFWEYPWPETMTGSEEAENGKDE